MSTNNSVEFKIQVHPSDIEAITVAMREEFPDATFNFVESDEVVPQVLQVFVPHGHPSLGMREQFTDGTSKDISTEVLLHAAGSVLATFEQKRI
jgi:hypothetical protein